MRVIAATNRDLAAAVAAGTLPPGSLVPAQRRQPDDAAAARPARGYPGAGGALRRQVRAGPGGVAVTRRRSRVLTAHDWPGNVRELENAIERAVVLGASDRILADDLPESLVEMAAGRAPDDAATMYHQGVADVKRRLILGAIHRSGGNYTAAARLLGLNPTYLHRLLRTLQLRDAAERR